MIRMLWWRKGERDRDREIGLVQNQFDSVGLIKATQYLEWTICKLDPAGQNPIGICIPFVKKLRSACRVFYLIFKEQLVGGII